RALLKRIVGFLRPVARRLAILCDPPTAELQSSGRETIRHHTSPTWEVGVAQPAHVWPEPTAGRTTNPAVSVSAVRKCTRLLLTRARGAGATALPAAIAATTAAARNGVRFHH